MTNLTHTEALALLSAAQQNDSEKLAGLILNYKGRNANSKVKLYCQFPEMKLLEQAIEFGYTDIVAFCLDEYEDSLNVMLKGSHPPIVWATECGKLDIIQLLIDRKADIYKEIHAPGRSSHKDTALRIAIESENVEIVKCIINTGVPLPKFLYDKVLHDIKSPELINLILKLYPMYLNTQDEYGRTPLILAARSGNLPAVQALIQHGANLNQRIDAPKYIDHQYTAIESATSHNQVEVVRFLMTIDGVIIDKQKLLCIASIEDTEKSEAMITLLLSQCIDSLSEISTSNYRNQLEYFAEIKCEWMPPDSNITSIYQNHSDYPKKQPLHYAIEVDNISALRALVAAGTIYTPLDPRYPKTIQYAAYRGSVEVLRFYLDATPSDLNCCNEQQQTLLYIAAAAGHENVVTYLIKQQVHVTLKDIQVAMDNMHYRVVNVLISNMFDEQNNTEMLKWVRSGVQAFDFIQRYPEKSQLLFQDARIKGLLQETSSINSVNKAYLSYYEPSTNTLKRRPSFFIQTHKQTGVSDVYMETKQLGSGAYGSTRIFSSLTGKNIAVKANNGESNIDKNEAGFCRKAYPDSQISDFFNFTITYHSSCFSRPLKQSAQRLIMPFFKGQSLEDYEKNIDTPGKLFLLILGLAQGLLSLHQKDIAHGDVAARNIIVEEHEESIKVSYVDFGLSTFISISRSNLDYLDFCRMIEKLIYRNPVISYQLILNYPSVQYFFENYPKDATKFNQFYSSLLTDYHTLLINYQRALNTYQQSIREGKESIMAPTLLSDFAAEKNASFKL